MSSTLKDIGKAIFELLTDIGGLSTRITPLRVSQGSDYPAATYHITDDEPQNTKTSLAGIEICSIELNIYATTYLAACTTASAVRAVLDGHRDTTAGVVIDQLLFTSEMDQYDNNEEKYIKEQTYDIRIKN